MNNNSQSIDTKDKNNFLSVSYRSASALTEIQADASVLAAIGYGNKTTGDALSASFHLAMPEIGEEETIEVWQTNGQVKSTTEEGISLRSSDEYLFGRIILEDDSESLFTSIVEDAYSLLLKTISEKGYPHLLRMWNYFPRINEVTGGLERYQQFCLGRYNALEKFQMKDGILPAASALGTHGHGLAIYFIAAKTQGKQIENPNQVSAFNYPREYSPRSPSFSRAMLRNGQGQTGFYISGTASITGHETRHAGDINKQLEQTLKNIDALVHAAGNQLNLTSARDLSLLKVYLRRADDKSSVQSVLRVRYGSQLPILFLHADICRENLLIEIEGIYLGSL